MPWMYEPQGYEMAGTWYLPDFWLPYQKCWIEIKGPCPDGVESSKLHDLVEGTGFAAYCFFGAVPFPGGFDYLSYGGESAHVWFSIGEGVGCDTGYWWCECQDCRSVGIEFEGRAFRLPCGHGHGKGDRGHNGNSPRLMEAYKAARSAQFR